MSLNNISQQENKNGLFDKLFFYLDTFWQSEWYFLLLLLIGIVSVATNQLSLGVNIYGLISAFYLALHNDIFSFITPFFMVFIIAAPAYQDFRVFMGCLPMAIVVAIAFVIHMIRWPGKFTFGKLGWGRIAVTLATFLGGIDAIAERGVLEYYYIFGLGLMLLIIYLLFSAQLTIQRRYDIKDRVCAIFYSLGLMMMAIVIICYVKTLIAEQKGFHFIDFDYRNYAATVLLLSCPMSVYFMQKNKLHGFVFLLFGVTMILTGSRSALLFGTIEVLLCAIYIWKNKLLPTKLLVLCLVLAIAGEGIIFFGGELEWILSRMHGVIISKNEHRFKAIIASWKDFLSNPIFGTGLGRSLYITKAKNWVVGSLLFYEFAPSQIIGSMGIIGVAAYGKMLWGRFCLLFKHWNSFTQIVFLSYLGILMISLANPGIFCPLPNAALMTILFTVTEKECNDTAQ